MSDNLEWQNRHFTLVRCKTLQEVIEDEKYVCRPDLPEFYNKTSVEEIIWDFADAGRYKCATDLMAYVGHHRAVIWWGYLCLKEMVEELKENPPKPIDIDSIGKSFEPEVPDFAKVEIPKATPEDMAELEQGMQTIHQKLEEARAKCDPDLLKNMDDFMNIFYDEFEKQHGMKFLDFVKKLAEQQADLDENGRADPNSPIFKECEKIKTELQKVRQETLDTIHTVLPPEQIGFADMNLYKVVVGIYNWIVAPDEVNAKICLDLGNTCPQLPPGLLAYCAFWAWGDMMAGEKTDVVVKAPAGLMSNGFTQFLLMCSLRKGGTRRPKERYKEFFRLGVEVLTGKNLWDKSVITGEVPHEEELRKYEQKQQEEQKAEEKKSILPPEHKTDCSDLDELEKWVTQAFQPNSSRFTKKYTRWTPDKK